MTSAEKKIFIALIAFLALGIGLRVYRSRAARLDLQVVPVNSASASPRFIKNPAPSLQKPKKLPSELRLDLNRASSGELEALPFIGPAKARAIVDWRQIHGPFKEKSDLLNVKAINISLYKKIEKHIFVR